MTTDELIRTLRNWMDVSPAACKEAADRLEELDERVAIMSEPSEKEAMGNISDAFDKFCKAVDSMKENNLEPGEIPIGPDGLPW